MTDRPTSAVFAVVLAAVLAFALVGCATADSTEESPSTSSAEQTTEAQTDSSTESAAVAVDPATLLTPADVEKVSGLTGLVVTPYDPSKGAGGKVNIATTDGQLVAMLVVEGPDVWEAWSNDGITFAEPYTPTIGDESHVGPNTGTVSYLIAFRKGDTAVAVDTFFEVGATSTVLSVDQLAKLAKIVESRL